jgi:hypothetical protein
MRNAHRLSLVVCLACVVPAVAQTPATVEEPQEPYLSFRVNAVTGALMPLESIWTKPERSGNRYFCYLPGGASPITFASGEPQRFVMRVGGLKDPPKLEKWQAVNKLERLQVGAKDRRYATKSYVPLDVTAYGQVTSTVDKKNKTVFWITLLYTPREPLPPGEYAFSGTGLSSPAGFMSERAQAFRIAAQTASNQRPPSLKSGSGRSGRSKKGATERAAHLRATNPVRALALQVQALTVTEILWNFPSNRVGSNAMKYCALISCESRRPTSALEASSETRSVTPPLCIVRRFNEDRSSDFEPARPIAMA